MFLLVWLLFFDRDDLISQYNLQRKLSKIRQEKEYYLNEIQNNNDAMKSLLTDSVNLEKFAREKYLMKKDNEDIFVIVETPDTNVTEP